MFLILFAFFQMGSDIQREVQEAHLKQIMQDVKGGHLAKAIDHLKFLHEDFGITEKESGLVDCSPS